MRRTAKIVGRVTAIFVVAFLVAVTPIFLTLAVVGRIEEVECKKWSAQATEFKGFYILQWQKDQCDAHDIEVGAPVR